ncbi:MAG: Pyrroline-5-carboxylate reductase [Desulfovibrio sp.]
MATRLGFIGFGNMGGAIAAGVSASSLASSYTIAAYDITDAAREKTEHLGGAWFEDPAALAKECEYIILAVKPYQIQDVIKTILPALNNGKTVISIAAGQPLSALRAALRGVCPAVQVMPNTPALVGEGVFGLCFDDPDLTQECRDGVHRLFRELGTVFILPESKMNALMAVTGCGPAFVYDMMDAIMEAAVTLGFTREEATDMTAALFKGSARMVQETKTHPAVLHSQVTSPKGSTIAGTNHLARTAVRGNIIDAVLVAYHRGKDMEQE